jgi:Tol biopolymer transport system component/DNA-binding winged helix-turn-helix (wHTH) protein
VAPFPLFRFGAYEADLRSGELRKSGARIKLQQQPFQVLVALLSRPGDVVTREELRQQLWPADTFVDFDHGLNAAIKRLRDALGESAETPLFIETVPRRGYRFLAPISCNNTQFPATNLPEPSLTAPRHPKYLSALLLFLGALVVAGLFLERHAWRRVFSSSAASPSQPMHVVPLATDPGAQFDLSFSPDGKQVAFLNWDGSANPAADVYVKLIGANQPLRLTHGNGGACCTAWSPDALHVAYERCDADQPELYLVPALGGPERLLSASSCDGISWSPDGTQLALVRKESRDTPGAIFLLNTQTLGLRRFSTPPTTDIGDQRPAFSTDGKKLAFLRSTSPAVKDIFVAPSAGGQPVQITFDSTAISDLAWTADGASLVFSSHRVGGMSLWRVPATGGTPELVPVGGSDTWNVSISRQGNKLAYTQGSIHPNIFEIQLDSLRTAGPTTSLIASTSGDGGPQFSPDGKKIAFYSARSGAYEIWTSNADGSGLDQLTNLKVLSGTPRWSPDGAMIAFDSRPSNRHSQILVIPAGGGIARPITSGENESAVPSWSRDGNWIYFTSNRAGGWELWKVSSHGGEPIQVTKKGGYSAFESADGKELFYVKNNEKGIWKRQVDGTEEVRVLDVGVNWGQWAISRNGIYFVDQTKPQPQVQFYEFKDRKISLITKLDRSLPPEEPGLDISPDEHRLLLLQVLANQNIMLVDDFH